MPDVYSKGDAHHPVATVTGHFIGMQPVVITGAHADKIWYRGDDYAEIVRQRDAWADTRKGWEAAIARVAELEAQISEMTNRIQCLTMVR